MKPPRCRLCGEHHWLAEPHVFKENHETIMGKYTTVEFHEGGGIATSIDRATAEAVTLKPKTDVTKLMSTVTKRRGRPPSDGIAKTHAERQKAYRERQA